MRFYHRLIRTLILPGNAGPDDAAIVIGPDVSNCMTAAGYIAALFFRPEGTIDDVPPAWSRFMGLLSAGALKQQNNGWVLDDGVNCDFAVDISSQYDASSGLLTSQIIDGDFTEHAWILDFVQPSSSVRLKAPTIQIDMSTAGYDWLVNTPSNGGGGLVSLPRGRHAAFPTAATTATGSMGTGGTSVFPVSDVEFAPGRAWEVLIGGRLSTSAATVTMNVQFRIDGTTKANFGAFGPEFGPSGAHVNGRVIVRNNTGSIVTGDVDLLCTASAGTVNWLGAAANPRWLELRDIGDAASYPTAPQV